jgi:monovalent cation:H+ antiporter-2, CPA2 family
MHANLDLILTLTYSLGAALTLGYVTHRLGLSPLVGYLLAGIVVGPRTPGFVADSALADQLAEIGVILLMFGVGLHFKVEDLAAVRRIAIPGAVFQSVAATLLATLAAVGFGWGWQAGVVFGLALSVASTVVLTRVLADNHALHTRTGHVAVGWLIVEDLFTVVILVLLPHLFGEEAAKGGGAGLAVLIAVAKFAALVLFTLVVGGRVIPWLLGRASATRSRELFTLSVLVIALGIAVGSALLFGVSMALGAFLAGMVVGRSEFSLRAASEALPLRDAFAVIFFVAAGMLFDPRFVWESPGVVASTLAVILLGKPLAALGIMRLLKHPMSTALPIAVSLGQIGEFSFILATVGRQLGVLPPAAVNAIMAGAIVSIAVNPPLYRAAAALGARAKDAIAPAPVRFPSTAGSHESPSAVHRAVTALEGRRPTAVIVGFGPIGRTLVALLRANQVEPRVIELNLETARKLAAEGVESVYGDAGRLETLEAADVDKAGTLILAASGLENAAEVARMARTLNPRIRVLARCGYLRERDALRAAGVDAVFASEGEIAMAMTESVLRGLGAAPEQIDRERERVRSDLLGEEARSAAGRDGRPA